MRLAGRPWLLRGTTLGLALVVGLAAWLSTRDDDEEAAAPVVTAEARVVGGAELADIAVQSGHSVYWLGPAADTSLEATELGEGGVQVRYLTAGAEPGEDPAAHLTVGSYPLPDPAAALDAFAARPGTIVRRSGDGREVVASADNPTSVYFASPDNSVQVEVYDPSPKRALALALSTRLRPVP